MKILIQVGNKGNSVVDHLVRPLVLAEDVEKAMLVARRHGPDIPKTVYFTPHRYLTKIPPVAILLEFLMLLFLAHSEKPSCIVGHKLFPHGFMASLVARLTGRPLVISLIAGPVELFSLGSSTNVDLGAPLSRKGKLLLNTLMGSTAIVTTGSYTKNFLVMHGLKEDKIRSVVHTPTPLRYHPTDTEKEYDVISVGRLAPVKHNEILLQAASIVREQIRNVRICIVGDGQCKGELKAMATSLGLGGNVDFVGFQEDVTSYYNKSRIFVLTSEREGLPNVLIEAMMCGLPSVVSNCGDISDLAVDGYNSIVIQRYDDYERFAEAIIHLMTDRELSARLSGNALKTIAEFPIERATREWQQILREVRDGQPHS